MLISSMIGSPKRAPKPAPASPPEPENFGPPVPPDYRYSLSVESGSYKSIVPPLEWQDIPPLAVLTGLNGTGKSQLLRSINMVYTPSAKKDTNIQLKLKGLSCKPHEVLFLSDFSKPMPKVESGIAQVAQQAEQYRNKQSDQGGPYEQQIRRFFHEGKVVNSANFARGILS